MDIPTLIEAAAEARENAYAPYSKSSVGAALSTKSGHVFTGCNVENASFGLTVCAERVAIFNAVCAGEKEFEALAVIAGSEDYCRPCGACRQVIVEFGAGIRVVMARTKTDYETKIAGELLPGHFMF